MKFDHTHHDDPRFPELYWDEWICGAYKIVSYHRNEFYAYYMGSGGSTYPTPPPHTAECHGCGSAHCTGVHKVWNTLDSAMESCIEHAVNLPW